MLEEHIVNPTAGIYPASEDYVHALEVRGATRQLFVSGTMGLDTDGAAPEGIDEQLALVWANIARILAQAGMTTDNIVRVRSYLSDRSHARANQDARLRALGSRRVPSTAVVVEPLSPNWLVEIEVTAVA